MVPAFAVLATQVGTCPADFEIINTSESDLYVTLNWEYPEVSPAPFSACEIQILNGNGDWASVSEYCDCST
jgi:hypothetical protein